jgi:spoIIIJ-associated protein
MSGTSYEFSAKNVDAAITEGLRQLGVTRDQVDIDVLHEGSRGLLGIGSSNARIRITTRPKPEPKPAPVVPPPTRETVVEEVAMHTSTPEVASPSEAEVEEEPLAAGDLAVAAESEGVGQPDAALETEPVSEPSDREDRVDDVVTEDAAKSTAHEDPYAERYDSDEGKAYDFGDTNPDELAELASSLLLEMLELMGFEAEVEVSWPEKQGEHSPLNLNVVGDDLGMLIGRHGETLSSMQYLIRLMVNQRIHRWTNIIVDVDGYKARRAEQLAHMAQRMAEQVIQTGRAAALEPMPANERRLVHIALRNHPNVYTESIGEADRRKVQILLK